MGIDSLSTSPVYSSPTIAPSTGTTAGTANPGTASSGSAGANYSADFANPTTADGSHENYNNAVNQMLANFPKSGQATDIFDEINDMDNNDDSHAVQNGFKDNPATEQQFGADGASTRAQLKALDSDKATNPANTQSDNQKELNLLKGFKNSVDERQHDRTSTGAPTYQPSQDNPLKPLSQNDFNDAMSKAEKAAQTGSIDGPDMAKAMLYNDQQSGKTGSPINERNFGNDASGIFSDLKSLQADKSQNLDNANADNDKARSDLQQLQTLIKAHEGNQLT